MNKEIFKSGRYFTVFDYSVSHGQLLLRSDKIKGYKENIDIIFYDTTFVQLFTMLYGVSISLADKKEIITYNSVREYFSYDNKNLFEIESKGEKYYIAASFVRVFENQLEFNESSINVEGGKENEIATSLIV